ncbi:MCE family protein [Nocardioides limicola]|uniref:MCE family protein n=1 Tax=Nocardioides limicola TaxID=2803368 RepID=UPI00193BD579|nr:MCE family protein [Nocardioides sp. DJM-14]
MKPFATRDPHKLGLVTLGVGLLVGALIVLASVVNVGTKSYSAVLEHTAGLRVGEDVQVSGVPVGKVTGIELADTDVRVSFVVNRKIELGDQTRGAVKVATLLGTHYLEVSPAGSGSLETIPLERTSVPYNLQDVIDEGAKALEELDAELLARAIDQMSSTLEAADANLEPALRGINRLSVVVATRSGQIGELLASVEQVSDQLESSTGDIAVLMRHTNLVMAEITARRQAIHQLLVETTRLSESLTAIVESTRDDLRPALRNLNRTLGMLKAQETKLKDLFELMAPAARYVANATGNGPWLDLWANDPLLPADDAKCRLGDCS